MDVRSVILVFYLDFDFLAIFILVCTEGGQFCDLLLGIGELLGSLICQVVAAIIAGISRGSVISRGRVISRGSVLRLV